MKRALALLLPNLFAASLCAQVGQFPGTSVPLASTWQQSIAVPAGNTPTLLNFAVDAPPAGQDTIDVLVVDPNVVISLILPAGTEINASNATANGFVFSTNTIAGVGADLTPFSIGGIHTIIQLPIPAQTGVYSVKADATNATADTAMVVWYYPSSTVALGAATDAPTYRQGDLVILSGLLFDGSTPIQNATVTAIAGTFLPVSGTVGNYQLVSTTQLDSTYSLYTYTAQFTNSGAAVNNVGATVAATDPNMVMVMDGVAFGTVPAGVPVTSAGTFSFIYPTATAYDLATLQWAVQVPDTPINVTLQDSGTYDYATGDGIYTGTLTPSDPGNYIVQISASGTSASGLPFVRTASTTFQVIVASAQIGAFSDAPTTDPTSGLITSVNITASVNVQIAGQYQLSLQLTASNGQSIPVGTMTQLNTGTGQILLSVSASEFLQLGVGGPYTIDNASLVLLTSTDAVQEDYQDPAGTTQAYTLASFSRGPLYFTGQNSASGANTSGGTLFSALDVQAGVGLSFPSQGQINCNWGATLTDGSGNEIAMTTGSGQLSNGNQTINFNFDGNLIGQSGASSFIVSNAFISCNGANANADPLMQIQGFTPSQFTNVPPDFTLSAPDFSIVPGASATIQLTLSGVGSFSDVVNFSVTGLPAGFTSSFGTNVLGGPGINFLTVTAPTGAALGTTTITIAYATSSVSKTLSIPMTVVSQAIAVSVSPANPIVPGAGTQQFFAVLANTSNQSVTWSLSTPLGTIDSNGLYAAPSSISAQQTVTVIATSAADASVTGGTTIYLSPLGGPWLDQDVGTVGTAGNASIASGVFMVQGAGVSLADNTPTNVGFNFLYQLADGNAGIVARIVSSTGVASVMMLNSLTAYASYAFVSINQAGSATFCYLGSSGLQCGTPTAVSFPCWVQLTREGNGLAGAISPDGVTWTPIGNANLSMGTAVYIGLAATSLSSSTLGSATFDNVSAGSVAISPSSVHLSANQTQQFSATSAVNWSISPSMGTVSSSGLYTAPSSVTTSQLVEVTATTLNNLARESAPVFLNASTASPVFTPPTGTYSGPQSVAISSATPGASINYTLDGSTPSETAGTLYTGPITVSATTTINAIAWSTGSADSPVVSATYTITNSGVATPTFSPADGTYASAQTVTISTATSGASIRFTLDGSTPSETAGTLYSGPITVSATTTINAIAYAGGLTDSSVATATYTIGGGSSNSAQFVKNDATTEGSWKGVYGGDGYNVIDDTTSYPSYVTVTPSGQSNYIWNTSTSDAWALEKAFSDTDRIEATWYTGGSFTVDLNFTDGGTHQLAVYCLDESGGSRTETISVLDGATSAVLDSRSVSNFVTGQYVVWNLSGHVVLNITNTGSPNAVISGLFFDVPGAVAPPWFYPPPRVWSTAQSVSLTTMAGASVRYTTDGSTPSETAGTLYSGPITVNSATTIKAMAYITGLNDSAVVSGTYTISPLLSPWTDQDIGSVGVAGSGAFDSTTATFTVQGSGTDVFNAPDQFNYLYQSLSGDGVIIARVVAEQNTYQTTKAGVMIRETTDPSAAFAFVSLAPNSGGVFFSTRADSAGPNYNGPFSANAPVWVKLVRQSNTFTGYYSSDGNTWTATGNPFTVSMASNVLIGLAVVSTNNTALTTAVFDNLSIGSGISVSVSPTTATLSANQTQQFTATITGTSNTAVTWSISPNVGTISSAGLYTAPSSISSQQTVTVTVTSVADSTKSGTAAITLTPPAAAPPGFSPVGGVYSSAQTVTISTTTTGASIRYTTDGSTPSETAGTLYSGPITVSATTTINAIAYESGLIDSAVSNATYTIAGLTWYNTAWSNRKAITINGSQVSGSTNLVNFPVLVSVTDANLMSVANGGNVGSANGNDILFTASDGATKLSHEIETYNPSTGQLIAWVSVPALAPAVNTVMYIYYGNVAAANQQNPTGVWDSYYEGVWHLPNGTTLSGNDSTSNANNAVSLNGTSAGTGEIDGAASLNGTSNFIGVSNSSSLNGWTQQTISLWMNGQSNQGNDARLIEKGANDEWTLIFDGQALALQNLGTNSVAITTNVAVADTTWHKIDVTMDNNSKAVAIYVDGVLNVSGTSASSAASTNNNLYMGEYGGGGYYYHGLLDEVRISNMIRSAAWIATEYNNESSPSAFLSEGTQQNSGAVATPAFSPAGGTYTSAQTVTISTTTSGASIRYTTDGSTPSETAGTLYSGPITVSATTTINAIAYESGMIDSAVTNATYTIAGLTWYNTAWSNRKSITINGSQVSGSTNLVNFPVLVSVTDANLMSVANGGNVGSANGNDILFTASDGATKLSHEIETYNPSTGQLIAWVSVRALAPAVNTVIYIYYGNVAAANQQNPTGVWDSYYEGVWHLPSGTTLSGNDSTSNANNAVSLNGTSAGTGEIDGAASFNGTSNYIEVSNSSSLNGWSQQTISLWMNGQSNQGNDSRLIEKGANDEWTLIFDNQALALANLGSNSVAIMTNVAVADTTWHKIDVTMDNNSKALAIYVDGVLNVSGTSASSATSTNNNIYMGQYGGEGYYYHGLLDEVRISNMIRSAAWIATEYNNESSPSTFLSEGTQQNSGAVAPPAFSPAGGTYTSAQTVTISTTTSGASIRYTTDGSTPSETVGTLYSGPITVSATTTINAIAYESGSIDSSIASATYTIEAMAATPTFSPAAGTYSSAQTVTISTATSGASIRYTLDGSTPSETAGTLYSGPVTVTATSTLKAIAYESGMIDSSIASATYTIIGSNSAQFVKTDSTTEGSWKGVYGGDGYNVIDDTTAYPGYVTVTPSGQSNYIWNGSTNDAWGLEKAFSDTDRIEATWYTGGSFTIDLNFTDGAMHQLAVYCLDESGGSRTETLSILDGLTSAVLDSRNASNFVTGQYVVWNLSGHVVLNITNTGSPNAVISGLFFDVPGAVAPPYFDPPARVWSTAQSVSLTTMAGASIRYTTDGSTPSETAGTLYSGPITVNSTTTIKAMAYITGLNDSAVVSGTYTISPLPSPWTDQDIGVVGVAGSGAFDPTSATFTIQGSGSEVYYAPDQFNYLSQSLSGDGVIIARAVTVQNIYQTTKAGVMIRETADPSSAFAFVSLAPNSGGVFFSTRADSAGPNYNGAFSATAPVWVQLVRQGNTFTGYYSSDGNTWTAAGSPYTVSMAANVLVGLAVVSTNNTALTTAVFDNVSIAATIAVSVSPTTASLSANQTQQFTATVTNTSNTAVTWSISPNVGTISSAGLYTAPSSISSQQTVTVTATSVADTTKSGTATITLTSQ